MSKSRQHPTWSIADERHLIVRTVCVEVASGYVIEAHRHDWHQLIHADSGVVTVTSNDGSWVAPRHWAVWAPAGAPHALRFTGASRLATVYLREAPPHAAFSRCAVVAMASFSRALIQETVARGALDGREAPDAALALLLSDALRKGLLSLAGPEPFSLPQPTTLVLRDVADALAATARTPASRIAARAGLSMRTLERRFVAETGLSVGTWRRQALLLDALQRLGARTPVKVVADDAGYASASAFGAAFKARFGTSPGRYFGTKADPRSRPRPRTDESDTCRRP